MFGLSLDASSVLRRIESYRERLRQLRPFFAGVASDIIYDELKDVFRTEGYGSWPPLSPRYAAWKRSQVGNKSILRFYDTYFDSATSQTGRGSVHHIRDNSLTIGVDERKFPGRYPLVHELGSGNIPARPVFDLARPKIVEPVSRAFCKYFFNEDAGGPRRRGRR